MEKHRARASLAFLLVVLLPLAVSCAAPADRETKHVIDNNRYLCGPSLLKIGGGAGDMTDDAAVTAAVKAALFADKQVDAATIAVKTFKGEVVLTGMVDSVAQSERAESVARSAKGVAGVKNLLKTQ